MKWLWHFQISSVLHYQQKMKRKEGDLSLRVVDLQMRNCLKRAACFLVQMNPTLCHQIYLDLCCHPGTLPPDSCFHWDYFYTYQNKFPTNVQQQTSIFNNYFSQTSV